jgi:NADH-quinone oxidoreductase subunit N
MFSLAGIPPLLGFWPKLVVFRAALEQHLYLLAVVGFLGSVVGAFYYIKIVKVMYFDAPGRPLVKTGISRLEGLFILIAALVVSPLGYLLIGPLDDADSTQNSDLAALSLKLPSGPMSR